jgi:RNA polymerase sigma-70 factor, ECF subfamily
VNSLLGSRTVLRSDADSDHENERLLFSRATHDADAFGELYQLHVGAVHAYAFRCCGSQTVAEEVTSATFEQALRGIAKFQWRSSGMRPWLLRIASNEVANFYRRQERSIGDRAQRAIRELTPIEPENDSESERIMGLRVNEMRTALANLHPRYQKAITLRYLAGLSAEDAADALQCSKQVLAVTLHRALTALRRSMETAKPTLSKPSKT